MHLRKKIYTTNSANLFFTSFLNNMNINILSCNYPDNLKNQNISTAFGHKGKPLTVEYIMKYHHHLLPPRVKANVQEALNSGIKNINMKTLHLETYAGLLNCNSLEEAKQAFPEFSDIIGTNVKVGRIKIDKNKAKHVIDDKFVLNVLKKYWGELKDKEEISAEFGLSGRWALDRLLQGSNFIGFGHNYPNLLRACNQKDYDEIAGRTRAWNEAHPEERRELNKRAAQAWKDPYLRQEQRERILKHDIDHPERIEKISDFSKKMWDDAIEVRQAMSSFMLEQPDFVRVVMAKKIAGKPLNVLERRIAMTYYNNFWLKYPHLKECLSESAEKVRQEKHKENENENMN